MGDTVHTDGPAAFSRAQRKIERWRQQHRRGAQIPDDLWREAEELACTHGISRTARALRLDYYSLKKRAAAAARFGERAPEFVEILPEGMLGPRSQCMIEIEDPSGAKMRIHLQGGTLPDVAALTRVFRECRS